MNQNSTFPPVRKTISVRASLAEAFEVFTQKMDAWWPRGGSHTILKAPLQTVVIEPYVGGRWYHRGVDGSECDLGRVLLWQPPRRLVLGWQLNGRWQYVAEAVSEVDVTFEPMEGDRVVVALEHRALHVFEDTAAALRGAVDSESGWPLLLQRYAAALEQGGLTAEPAGDSTPSCPGDR